MNSPDLDIKWVVLDLGRQPPRSRCCHLCNPDLNRSMSVRKDDPRFLAHAADFIFPIADPPSVFPRPESVMSNQTVSSTSSRFSNFVPVTKNLKISASSVERLRLAVTEWRDLRFSQPGSILSCHVLLPHKQINNIASTGSQFLEMTLVSCKELQCISQWDSASGDDLDSLIEVIHAWREDTTPMATPKSQHCNEKAWEAFDTLPIPQLNPSIAAPAMNPLPETVTDGKWLCS